MITNRRKASVVACAEAQSYARRQLAGFIDVLKTEGGNRTRVSRTTTVHSTIELQPSCDIIDEEFWYKKLSIFGNDLKGGGY